MAREAIIADGWPEDPWRETPPQRDVADIEVQLAGRVVAERNEVLAFGLSFPDDVRAERAANAYLVDLADTFARPLTLRSYGYDILRWLRFLAAVGVAFGRGSSQRLHGLSPLADRSRQDRRRAPTAIGGLSGPAQPDYRQGGAA